MTVPDLESMAKAVAALESDEMLLFTLPGEDVDLAAEIEQAIAHFDAGDRPAARAATQWLRERARREHSTARTRLLLEGGQIAGFFALCSTTVQLTAEQRESEQIVIKLRSLPATLLAWIAKDHRAELDGRRLIVDAGTAALAATRYQASVALVVDPFDEDTGAMWQERYGFQPTMQGRRLWIPMPPG